MYEWYKIFWFRILQSTVVWKVKLLFEFSDNINFLARLKRVANFHYVFNFFERCQSGSIIVRTSLSLPTVNSKRAKKPANILLFWCRLSKNFQTFNNFSIWKKFSGELQCTGILSHAFSSTTYFGENTIFGLSKDQTFKN